MGGSTKKGSGKAVVDNFFAPQKQRPHLSNRIFFWSNQSAFLNLNSKSETLHTFISLQKTHLYNVLLLKK